MDLIDAHVHADTFSWSNFQEMSLAGIRAVVSVPVCPWRAGISTSTVTDLINRLLYHETWRAGENNIQLFVGVGLPAVSIPKDLEKFFPEMEKYLKEPRVVAVGELGFDPRSQVCKDIKRQAEILQIQLRMAKEHKLPVILHTPPDLTQVALEVKEKYEKREFMEKTMELVHEVGLSPESVVLDHLDTEEWVKFALDNGCYAGITIQSWRATGPEKVAAWVDTFGPERMLLNTDASTMPSDHLGVPKTVFHLRKRKVPEKKIQSVVYENPIKFYRLPL
ncbi:MAG: TatD family hydrolase [Pseudomonadota bacterium]